jgi:hypothetical protein
MDKLSKSKKPAKKNVDSIWTNADLVERFQYLNDLFFGGKVKLFRVAFGLTSGVTKRNADGAFYPEKEQILINPRLRGISVYITIVLLHEMAHANLDALGYRGYPADGGHGGLFQVELDRLYRAGAYENLL